ncbi:MAG: pyruvate, phosphate dikinase [Rhodobacter sp.]|nr:pyruvate, phosphate dikinase [Rhodobacter sp.]
MTARWTLRLGGHDLPDRALIGGKAWSIARMAALGLPVPPAFVITTRACAAAQEGAFPEGLAEEIAEGMAWLEAQTGRRFGTGPAPLLVSVRSGAPVSMPGMMDTILNMGICEATEGALAAETGDAAFARDTHRRFWDLYAHIVLKSGIDGFDPGGTPATWAQALAAAGGAMPPAPGDRLHAAIRAVFDSWNSRRAKRYRQHHGIADDLGTAVTVQAMVFGNLSDTSGTGVMFSRNPITGERVPYGEYLPRAQGEDVVSGKFTPRPLAAMPETVPEAYHTLLAAAERLEQDSDDVQDIEFTVQNGWLYLLQSRAAKRAPAAAVRIAVEMVREGRISPATALGHVTPDQVRTVLAPRLPEATAAAAAVLAQGEAACPGIGIGVVVTDTDEAERLGATGADVILARATTSPEDLHGMIVAKAVITEQGGSTSHAALVSRALGVACVVGCGLGQVTALAGQTVTVDGATGRIYRGALAALVPDELNDADLSMLRGWAEAASPVTVLPFGTDVPGLVDLNAAEGGEDPANLPRLLTGATAATGGALSTEAGMAAALAAGVRTITGTPSLPLLVAAARAARQTRETRT